MATTVDDVVERILTRTIDKQDALRSFDDLSEAEKNHIVASLKSRLGSEPAATPDAPAPTRPLRCVHEGDLDDTHKAYIAELAREFSQRTAKSKRNALEHQRYFVDQRKVAGLKRALKPMQYQLTYDRAEGAYLHDVDGNRYVDITGDNGVNFFGHQPEFIKDALIKRLNQGYPLVAYSEDLFETARLFCEITGHERMVFTQSGTEAVMWAARMARAATGKKKVVLFDGSYHGLSDTVLAMRGRNGATLSAGLGMLQEFADQIIILEYGDMSQLDIIERQADDIACLLVEPIQSRFPTRRPAEFVRELRRISLERNIVLIFDEMITGFRAGRKGAEGYYKVKPDIATYGKVAGGGMPTGIIAGIAKYMDYIDGGVWELDDATMPSIRRAVMAGTHTQNSLKVSASLAACRHMLTLCTAEECDTATCDCAIGALNRRTAAMCDEINAYFHEKNVPMELEYFASLFRLHLTDDPYGLVRELLIILLKTNGIETSTSGNNFLNLAHGDAEARAVVEGFRRSIDTLVEHRFFYTAPDEEPQAATPPAVAAKPAVAPAAAPTPAGAGQIELLRQLILADLRGANGKGN
jgi:glutamate-1-semialdehyde aminotransferase